jgi:hypothetical protein
MTLKRIPSPTVKEVTMMIGQGSSIELLEMTSVMVIIKRTNVAISVSIKRSSVTFDQVINWRILELLCFPN